MFEKIIYILFGITFIHTLYFIVTGLLTFKKDKNSFKKCPDKTKFAILIAARNEENVIGDLLDSLKRQNYKKDLYDIYTIINNCTDNTKEIALDHGSKIIDVKKQVSTKGEALRYAIDELKSSEYDSYIVFDADNIVDANFLSAMNRAYSDGFKIAQGRRDAKNAKDSWISSSYALFYYVQNIFYNRARIRANMNSSINGTGFMIDKSLMEDIFYPKTMTEDIELSLLCTLKSEFITYVDDAITYDEHPTKFTASWRQRIRWSSGSAQCTRIYSISLLKQFFKTGNMSCIDKVMFLITPYVQIFSFILTLILSIMNINITTGVLSISLILSILFNVFSYLGAVCAYLLVIHYCGSSISDNFSGALLFNIFVISWIFINIVCLFKKNVVWDPIEHGNKKASNT